MKLPKQTYIALAVYTVILIILIITYHNTHKKVVDKPVQIETQEVIQDVVETENEPKTQKSALEDNLKYLGEYAIYAYCPCKKCCGKTNGITASGTKATPNRTVAANLPFGTRLLIDGKEYVVEDRGGGIKDKQIDVYMATHTEAVKAGVSKAKVYEVREWNN